MPLNFLPGLPITDRRGNQKMHVTVRVPNAVVREARVRDIPLIEFVESLIEKGIRGAQGRPDLERAMTRLIAIRAEREAAERAAVA